MLVCLPLLHRGRLLWELFLPLESFYISFMLCLRYSWLASLNSLSVHYEPDTAFMGLVDLLPYVVEDLENDGHRKKKPK